MSNLEKKLESWEVEQSKQLKKTLKSTANLSLYTVYLGVKYSGRVLGSLSYRPLCRQIEPGKYEEVDRRPQYLN